MQTTGYIKINGEIIKILVRQKKYSRLLKFRTSGKLGIHFSDEEDYLSDGDGSQLTALKKGEVIDLQRAGVEKEEGMKLLKRIWKSLDIVPNCPACHGTGEPTGQWVNWADSVWWKGQIEKVCHNCRGKGKV